MCIRDSCNTSFARMAVETLGADRTIEGAEAVGQFEVAASPLQMALVAAGIANDGVIMAPHTVDELRDGDGDVIETCLLYTSPR